MTGRKSGVLLHISSLMGEYGIGTFGKEAKRFIDFLEQAGFHYWQVLPFTRIDACHSPYKSDSAFAGNLLFLDPEDLRDRDLLTEEECRECRYPTPYAAACDWLLENRPPLFRKAFSRMDGALRRKVEVFQAENASWLPDYGLYMADQGIHRSGLVRLGGRTAETARGSRGGTGGRANMPKLSPITPFCSIFSSISGQRSKATPMITAWRSSGICLSMYP